MLNKKYFFVAVTWTLSVLYLSFREKLDLPEVKINFADKIVHFTFYFLFVWFWYHAFSSEKFNKKAILNCSLFAIIFGILIEIGQETLTINRHFDWFDIIANSLGAIVANGFITTKHIQKSPKI